MKVLIKQFIRIAFDGINVVDLNEGEEYDLNDIQIARLKELEIDIEEKEEALQGEENQEKKEVKKTKKKNA